MFDSSAVQLVMRSTNAPNADRLKDQVQLFDEHQQHRQNQGEAGSGGGAGALQTEMGTMSGKLGEDPGSSPLPPSMSLRMD